MKTDPYLDFQIFISENCPNNPRKEFSVKRKTGERTKSHGWLAFEYIRQHEGLTLKDYLNISHRFNFTGVQEPRHVWHDLEKGNLYLKHPLTGEEIHHLTLDDQPVFPHFTKGLLYNRQNDIHQKFGGQERGGISTPKEWPLIFLFTGSTGDQFGYEDYEEEDGTFHYFGEGQTGDMEFVRNNKAIRDHAENGKDLLLFETRGKGKPVRFKGEYGLIDWDYVETPDQTGAMRKAIVFNLFPTEKVNEDLSNAPQPTSSSLEDLRRAALEASNPNQQKPKSGGARTYYQRSKDVRDYVLARANGSCENCANSAPFIRSDGSPYLEPHHIRKLSDGGPDHPFWVAGICPNCHREAHYGENRKELNKALANKIQGKEGKKG